MAGENELTAPLSITPAAKFLNIEKDLRSSPWRPPLPTHRTSIAQPNCAAKYMAIMSSSKKHSLDGEVDEVRHSKKVKTTDGDATVDDAPVKTKDKKDKKEKKNKKEKKEKKRKEKELAHDAEEEAPAAGEMVVNVETTTPAAADDEPAPKEKSKKSKDKKEKKSRKEANVAEDDKKPEVPALIAAGIYKQTPALAAVPESEIEEFLKTNHISVHDPTTASSTVHRPILRFDQLPTTNLMSKSPFGTFTNPTPIQSASWPYSLSGRDVIGIAETGSGKTYAFSLPCIEALLSSPKPKNKSGGAARARAVIVSPTRELAMQTHESIAKLASLVGLSAVCIYGGASKDTQRSLLRQNNGADIIVATPGRLKDFLQEGGAISLADAEFVVLDEADRMLDKGFEEDIKQIIGQCPDKGKRQTLMFTATWPSEVRGLAESFMVDPVKVIINKGKSGGDGNGAVELEANVRIAQSVEVVDPRGKEQRLLQILKEAQAGKAKDDRVLVFCLYKKETTRVEEFLTRRGLKVAAIHGDLRQEQRTRSLEAFKAGTTSILLATDVAARGLDIPEVKLVVNLTVTLHSCLSGQSM